MIDYLRMLWAETLLMFNIGITIKIKVTLRCNLHCSYCCVTIADGHRAQYQELTAAEWLKVVENFPLRVRKVIILGGETFLRSDVPYLINQLTAKRIIVKAESNGLYRRMLEVNPTPFFKAILTYHHEMTDAQKEHWQLIRAELRRRGYRVLVNEIMEAELPGSQVMPLVRAGDTGCYYRRDFIFLPNGKLVFCIQDACSQTGTQEKVAWNFDIPENFYSIYDVKEKFRILFGNRIKSMIHKLFGLKMKEW